ncbi:MAG: NAD(P)/FAD-dependent oxidoreductase, partial [Mycobacterium sp.]|nr:NAD(P)/FAD-dependent oxidoreductase [Mycobacterium sp.]
MRNPNSGAPFMDSDDEIAAALQDVSIPTLLLSCVHMTDDESVRRAILEGPIKPAGLFLNEVQGYMSEEDKAAARTLALDIIRDYRDRGCPEPEPIDAASLKQMMNWLVAGEVGDEYVPMMLEEMGLDGRDAREAELRSDPLARREFPVVVIGAGQSGLLAAIRLEQAGVPYTVIEKNPGVGGTWWENSYPGARVDVGNHFYCYSFEPCDHWSEFFARQPELQKYFADVMERHRITEHVRFNTAVLAAAWDDAAGEWAVTVRDA